MEIILIWTCNISPDAWTALFTGGLVFATFFAIAVQSKGNKEMLKNAEASSNEQRTLLLRQIDEANKASSEQRELLLQQINDAKESSFKESSFKLTLDLQREFRKLKSKRIKGARLILEQKILTYTMDYRNNDILRDYLGDIYDLFDTMGFYVANNFVDAEFIHHAFSYWIFRYYKFYTVYNLRKVASEMGIENTVWSKIETLTIKMNEIEIKNGGGDMINRTFDLNGFFHEESNLN